MRNRRLLLPVVACLAVTAFVAAAAPSSADHGGPFHDGDVALLYANPLSGDGLQGAHLDGFVNEYGTSQIGGIGDQARWRIVSTGQHQTPTSSV